jgi:hypothetical protein
VKKRGSSSKAGPIEREIELALRPGSFIRDGECFSFVSGLDQVASTIDKLIATEASRAVTLYEVFLAGCHAKADELDESREMANTAGKQFSELAGRVVRVAAEPLSRAFSGACLTVSGEGARLVNWRPVRGRSGRRLDQR